MDLRTGLEGIVYDSRREGMHGRDIITTVADLVDEFNGRKPMCDKDKMKYVRREKTVDYSDKFGLS
jgi:hypothetical protein